jgi:hypothetical protein
MLETLNKLINIPVEKWPKTINLRAVSIGSNGLVNSGLCGNIHFFRRGDKFETGK